MLRHLQALALLLLPPHAALRQRRQDRRIPRGLRLLPRRRRLLVEVLLLLQRLDQLLRLLPRLLPLPLHRALHELHPTPHATPARPLEHAAVLLLLVRVDLAQHRLRVLQQRLLRHLLVAARLLALHLRPQLLALSQLLVDRVLLFTSCAAPTRVIASLIPPCCSARLIHYASLGRPAGTFDVFLCFRDMRSFARFTASFSSSSL